MATEKKISLEPVLSEENQLVKGESHAEPDLSAESHSPSHADEPWLEENLRDLKAHVEMASQTAVDTSIDSYDDFHDQLLADEGVLEMSIKGKITLKLKGELDGQDILLRFGLSHLQIVLSDGMEFKIPMKSKALKKSA